MEEKKEIKIRLGTIICIAIILLIVIAGGVIWYINKERNDNKIDNKVVEGNNINVKEKESYASDTIYDHLINIVKERGEYDYVKLERISEKDGEYYATVNIFTTLEITNEQYNDMVKNKKIELDGIEYEYYQESNAEKDGGITADEYSGISEKGYGAIKGFKEYDGNSYEMKYKVIKYNEGYAFLGIPAIESIWGYYTEEIVTLPIKSDTYIGDGTVEEQKDIINEELERLENIPTIYFEIDEDNILYANISYK